jgi:hypothetical protein
MLNTDTFLTTLYTAVDDFCISDLPPEPIRRRRRGPLASLWRSEVVTLALFGQFARFASERDFWRFADHRLRHLFPNLPDRSQFSRLQREHQPTILAFGLYLARAASCHEPPGYECLDRVGVQTRWLNRRGVGWLTEYADIGTCSRLGWFHGLSLLTSVSDAGVVTGFALGPASVSDQPAADAFLGARHTLDPRLPSAGHTLGGGFYLLDKGFTGAKWHARWRECFGAHPICAPQKVTHANPGRHAWPKPWRVWLARHRQIIETVHEKLLNAFRLAKERPHDLSGLTARLSAKVAVHNFCFWLNRQHGRPGLAFADLIDW